MEQKHGKKTKILNLVTSILVTAVCILVWHFVLPYIKATNLVKLVCYGILLFDVLWITDAALTFWRLPAELSEQEKTSRALTIYALVGFIVFLLFAAVAHAAVAVIDGSPFKIGGFEKSGFAIVGFSLLLINSLHHEERRMWTIISGIATFAVGIIFASFLNLTITLIIMSVVVAIYFFADIFMISKKIEASPIRFSLLAIVYIGLFALSLLMIHFIYMPIHLGTVAKYLVYAVINLAFALVVDAAIIGTHLIIGKKKKAEAK